MGQDLGQLLINSSLVFTLGVQLTLLLAAVFGLWVTGRGLTDLYVLAAGDNRFSNSHPSIFGGVVRLLLGGAMIVMPTLLWVAAETFTAGGSETEQLFNYGAVQGQGYCDQIRVAITYLFMLVGVIAWFKAGSILHGMANGGSAAGHGGHPLFYLVGGTLTFFVTDVSILISNTLGMEVGFDGVCKMLQ